MGIYRFTAHSFVILRFVAGLIVFILDPAEHLHLVNPCNFKTLDRFKHSWLVTYSD